MRRSLNFLMAVTALILTSVGVKALQWQDTLQGLLHDSGGLLENTLVGSTIGTLKAIDPTESVIYAVESNEYFVVNATSGVVVLKQRIIQVRTPEFNVTFYASTSSNRINASYLVIVEPIPTSGPVFQNTPYIAQVAESASVGSVLFSGIAITDTDPNAQISLLCLSNQGTCSTFTIVSQPATLISSNDGGYLLTLTASVQLNSLLNFAQFPSYTLTLQAVDTGAVQKAANVTITISVQQAQGPYFINTPITLTMPENSPLGWSVGTIQARKKVASDSLTLTILQDPKKYFQLTNYRVVDSNTLSVQVSVNAANISSVDNAVGSNAVNGLYNFIVQLTEISSGSASMTTTTNVSVIILDANNHMPTFNRPSYIVYVQENSPFSSIVNNTNITVIDADLGNNSFFQLSITNPGAFSLLPFNAYGFAAISLFVSTNVSDFYDYENMFYRVQQYQMVALETQTAEGYAGYASLTVKLTNVDEYYPVFVVGRYSASVTNNRPTGFVVLTVTATDADDDVYGQVSYSINSTQIITLFSVDSQSGDIRVAAPLTAFANQIVAFNCTATDGGGLATNVPVFITIVSFVPEGIQFSEASYTGTLNETSTTFNVGVTVMASVVGTAVAGSSITYRIISGNTNDRAFVIDAVTGKLSVTRLIAYTETQQTGQFVMTVSAEVLGSSPLLSSTVTVTVKIINSNSHIPVFSQSQYIATVGELATSGTFVTRVQSTSLNVDRYTQNGYKLLGGSNGKFVIDSSSGIISVATGAVLLIASNQPQYILTIQAYVVVNPLLVALATVVINITPANLNFPSFAQNAYVAFISDSSPIGTTVTTVYANDVDKTANIVYSIVANGTTTGKDNNGNPLSANITASLQNAFAINSQSGIITNNMVLNASIIAEVTLIVRAIDTNGQSPTPQVTTVPVTVSIEVPTTAVQFVGPWTPTSPQFVLNVRELEPVGMTIAVLFALDAVANAACTKYSKVSGTDPNNYFSIQPTTGGIVLNTLIRYDNLSNPQLTFDMQAFASSGVSALAHVIVNILKVSVDIPIFPQNSYTFQLQSAPIPGLVIGSVQASDVNTPPYLPLIYNLSENGSSLFAIDNTGTLTVASGASFAATMYNIFVTATNSAPNPNTSLSATVGVQIMLSVTTNTAPRFIPSAFYEFVINANVNTGTFVGQVVATATIGAVTYNIASGNTHNLFSIGNGTGYIVTAGSLNNYVNDAPIVLVVTAANNAQPPQITDCNVAIFIVNYMGSRNTVFFYFPAYDGEVVYVDEGQQEGSKITQLTGNSSIQSQRLFYYFEPDSYVASDESYFFLNYTSGNITSLRPLDREVQDTYSLIVVVTDGEHKMARRLIIQLNDIDDHSPIFDKCDQYIYYDPVLAYVAEGQSPLLPVWTVQACDPDGINNTIYYYFIDCTSKLPTSEPQFMLNSTTGTIFTAVSLNYETQNSFNLCVVATNSSKISTSYANALADSIQKVTVHVLNIDNAGPSFASVLGPSKTAIAGVLATMPYGTQIIRLPAYDIDQYLSNMPLQYSIVYQQYGNGTAAQPVPFLIDADTSAVTSAVTSYVPYLGQYFVSKVSVTDSQSRTDNATLKTYVVRETDQLKYTINMPPDQLQRLYPQLLQNVSNELDIGLYAMSLKYSSDNSGRITYSQSDLCFFVLFNDAVLNSDVALKKLRSSPSALKTTYDLYNVTDTSPCTVRVTTMYWSGYWWLWWWLIALALLILLLTLILILIVCIMWCRHGCHTVHQQKTKPVVIVVDQQPQLDIPDAMYPDNFEWQEQRVHVK